MERMLFTLDEIMTPREACDRWEITLDNLHMKLNRLKNSDVLNGLIEIFYATRFLSDFFLLYFYFLYELLEK